MSYAEIFDKLSSQCKNAKLMAVSKTRSIDEVREAYRCGFKIFGENHVQEIVEKFTDWHPEDVEVHMIGHLQSNKVNKVVPLVDMIQSVDSYTLLEKINNSAKKIGKIMPVLLEFNTSEEDSKSGFETESDIIDCIEKAKNLTNIQIKGLMTVGPLDHSKARESFAKLRNLSIKCQRMFPMMCFEELSMGMSQDYRIGIEEGSTLVRIGTLIFGERHYV